MRAVPSASVSSASSRSADESAVDAVSAAAALNRSTSSRFAASRPVGVSVASWCWSVVAPGPGWRCSGGRPGGTCGRKLSLQRGEKDKS